MAARRPVEGLCIGFSFAFPEVEIEKTEGGGGEGGAGRLRDGLGFLEAELADGPIGVGVDDDGGDGFTGAGGVGEQPGAGIAEEVAADGLEQSDAVEERRGDRVLVRGPGLEFETEQGDVQGEVEGGSRDREERIVVQAGPEDPGGGGFGIGGSRPGGPVVADGGGAEEVGEGDGEEEVGTESGQDDGEEEVVEDAVGEMVNNEETKKEEKPDYGKNESLVSTVLVTKINQQKQSIFNEMESLVGLVNKEVVDLEEKFKQKSKDFEELLENFNKLEKDHKKLQAKFDGIKQLFN